MYHYSFHFFLNGCGFYLNTNDGFGFWSYSILVSIGYLRGSRSGSDYQLVTGGERVSSALA